jgi:hypothetical protein
MLIKFSFAGLTDLISVSLEVSGRETIKIKPKGRRPTC